MKPGPKDTRYRILIIGRELEELKKHTWMIAEAFGLDRRIELYQGKRPVTSTEYPGRSGPGYEALRQLHDRIERLREQGNINKRG